MPASDQSQLNPGSYFRSLQSQMMDEFKRIQFLRGGDRGAAHEDTLRGFLNRQLPERLAAVKGLVWNQDREISLEQDVLIYDRLQAPVLRISESTSIVPVECVLGSVQVKGTLTRSRLTSAVKNLCSIPWWSADQYPSGAPLAALVPGFQVPVAPPVNAVFAWKGRPLPGVLEDFKEACNDYPRERWPSMVVVLERGIIAYVRENVWEPNADHADHFSLVLQDDPGDTLRVFYSIVGGWWMGLPVHLPYLYGYNQLAEIEDQQIPLEDP